MSKGTILIVEDEVELAKAYMIILEKEGYDVTVAYDGQNALDLVKDFEPNLILLDLRMPRLGGIDFLKEYKPSENHPKTKVIVFSNLDSETEVNEAYDLGANKYMLKAWSSPKDLAHLVENTLKGK